MREPAEFSEETDDRGAVTLRLAGQLLVSHIGALDHALRARTGTVARIDLSGVTAIDTVGAWVVWRLAHDQGAEIAGASDQAQRLIEAVGHPSQDRAITPPRHSVFFRVPASIGDMIVALSQGTVRIIGFMGAILVSFRDVARRPSNFRSTALVRQMELVGVNSLAIVAMMSFLVGIVIAQQGSVQLQQFGAQIYTVNLTGRLAMRELGVLMTAIMVAGRSGSAFAAQLGTMKLTEEIDAMRTIGVSPMQALVVPRVLAAILMLPLLGFFASLMAIVGGAVISSFTLGIPFFNFIQRVRDVVPITDMYVGLTKGPVFGLIVAVTGCYQGMQVSGNSEEVGQRTTMAVVQAIFMVIVLDAFFAVFFTKVGWN